MNHIVCLSGGKDSTAMALKLKEVEPRDYIYICTPTGDELPPMSDHWDHLGSLLDAPILRLTDPDHPTIFDLIEHYNMLPNWRARWCTRILKIEVAINYYRSLKGKSVIYVGLRADEKMRKGNKLFDDDIRQDFPMQRWCWGIKEVMVYLDDRGVAIPARTDCGMCFYQRIGEWWDLWKYHPDRFRRYCALEEKIGHTIMSPGKHKNWPHALIDLGMEFKKGRIPIRANINMELFQDVSKCRVCSM